MINNMKGKVMINTIILDMGMVLIDFRWKELFHEMGLTGEKFDKMVAATVNDPVWNEFDRGVWTDEMMEEAFVKNAPELKKEISDFMNVYFPNVLRKFDYTDAWLDALKAAGYRLLILSNFSEKAFRDCVKELDYVSKVDEAVISCNIHMLKPDPEIFEYIISNYDIVPEETVFIDDNVDNINTAKTFGLNTVLFTGKDNADEELRKLGVKY